MPEATVCQPSIFADTIMRTIEPGVTIADAAVDEKTTTIFCTPVARGRPAGVQDAQVFPVCVVPVHDRLHHDRGHRR